MPHFTHTLPRISLPVPVTCGRPRSQRLGSPHGQPWNDFFGTRFERGVPADVGSIRVAAVAGGGRAGLNGLIMLKPVEQRGRL